MSYSFQTFSVGEVLTASKMDQVEVNIRDHQHGVSGVSANTSLQPQGVRQTVLTAKQNSSGNPVPIEAGTGLSVNLVATASALVLAFGAGFNAYGAVDYHSRITADASAIVSSIAASNTTFINAEYSSASAVTWQKTLCPPRYSYGYDATAYSILHFNGADASTSIIDGGGNTWTAVANAQLDTAQAKFGASSLLLDGTGDYVESTEFRSLGDGSWEMSCWFRISALPGSGNRAGLITAENASNFGAYVSLYNNGGTTKLELNVSSAGASNDVVNATVGTNTTWTLAQWNRIRLVFDALGGTYRVYLSLNAAAETADISASSSTKTCGIARIRLGRSGAANDFNGWIDEFRYIPYASNTSTETPSASAYTITDQEMFWFSIGEMVMYKLTTESAAAGTSPGLTAENVVFVADCDTSGAAVTAVRNAALRGEYRGEQATLATATQYSFNHNIGTSDLLVRVWLECVTADITFVAGDRFYDGNGYTIGSAAASYGVWGVANKKTITLCTGVSGVGVFSKTTGVSNVPATDSRWKAVFSVKRPW